MKRHMRILYALALLLALGVSGTAGAQPKGAGFEDSVITGLVSAAIHNDPMLSKTNISIETRDGVVHLTGFARSMAQIDRAGALARRVEGVSAVRNTIRVANLPSRARYDGDQGARGSSRSYSRLTTA